jgi:hypothetical protein
MENTEKSRFTIDDYRAMKESGVDPYTVDQTDAASQEDSHEADAQEEADVQESSESQETGENDNVSDDNDADETIPPEQKNAFYKRVQREKKKAQEEAETRLRAEFDSQLNPYKAFFDSLGITPEQAMQQIENNRLQQEAEQLAYTNGWSEQETQMYMRQQQLERKQLENDVALRIYELGDTADFPGIKGMKSAITEFIRANPRSNVEQAYWAVGGSSLAQQLKREAEQREIAKRQTKPRTVVSDAPQSIASQEALPPELLRQAKSMGMSEKQARTLMQSEFKDIDSYRKWKKEQGRK